MTTPVITPYNPEGIPTAGNSLVIAATALANLNAPKLSECAGQSIQCALGEFGITKEVSWQERRKLCHTYAQEMRGRTTLGLASPLRIALTDPQEENAVLARFVEGALVPLIHRPGKPFADPVAVGDLVQVVRGYVGTVTLAPVTTTEGEEYEAIIDMRIRDMNSGFLVPIVAD